MTNEVLQLLLVEDDLVDRRTVHRMLEESELAGQVTDAEELMQALEALASVSFDCILLDLNLPDGDGLDLLHRLQEADGVPAPVIVLTGLHEQELATQCLQSGAQDYLVKGEFDTEALVKAIRYAQERFRLSEETQRQADALADSNTQLERFAYVASHDLQEPLRTLRAMGARLGERFGDTLGEEGGELLDRMLGAAERMQELIRDLLDLSRVSTDKEPEASVDLLGLLEEVQADLGARLTEDGQSLNLHVPGELPAVQGVPSQLRRLLSNLIGNALKFRHLERPPMVTVSAVRVPAGRLDSFGDSSSSPRVELTVSDNGIGIDPGQAQAIFEPFKRLHGRTRYPGTGIGLAICKAIVERHGGRIRAEGTPGEGASFVFTLPTGT